ncbi:MAG: Crp/Fnr family transcriptional regulator [Bacteroidaceae bacterium]
MVEHKGIIKDNVMIQISDLWNLLSSKEKKYLYDKMEVFNYKRGETIYAEGQTPHKMYCLLHGKVKIFKEGIGGRCQIIRVIKPVQYFAYRAYFAAENFVTTAAAFEDAQICSIPMKDIESISRGNNGLAMFFVKMLAVDLGISDKRTVSLTQNHIRGRLAESLLFLKENYGLEEDDSTLSIYLSREDLASLANMTTANAIRTLSVFSAEKLIAIDGRKIKLIDEWQLHKIARIG